MTTKNMQIKSHGWHNVTLTGNLLTGDTFEVRDFIKTNLAGKWDNGHKGWIVDLEKVAHYTAENSTTLISK